MNPSHSFEFLILNRLSGRRQYRSGNSSNPDIICYWSSISTHLYQLFFYLCKILKCQQKRHACLHPPRLPRPNFPFFILFERFEVSVYQEAWREKVVFHHNSAIWISKHTMIEAQSFSHLSGVLGEGWSKTFDLPNYQIPFDALIEKS